MRLKPGFIHIFACLFCLCGCTTIDKSQLDRAVQTQNLPPSVELAQTPFFPQTANQCGPAALATVLRAHNSDITPEALSSQLYIPDRRGSLQVEIAVAARKYAMLPYPLRPEFIDILEEVAAGNPVLVLQNLGFEWWPQWHYAVVIGYDIEKNELILRSGNTRRWLTSFNAFNSTWHRAHNWALVIVPVSEIPATANLTTYLKTAYAFEETGLTQYALEAYHAASQNWPNDSNAWLILGTLAYKAGDGKQAVDALLQAVKLKPDSVFIWNNLAYALHTSGCAEQAQQSLQCARQYSPDDKNISDSEEEIKRLAIDAQANDCPQITCN